MKTSFLPVAFIGLVLPTTTLLAQSQPQSLPQSNAESTAQSPPQPQARRPTPPDFDAVDKDKDGHLSFTEARTPFPTLALIDADTDGMVSKKEAKEVLPNVVFEDDHETHEALIGAGEYGLMVEQYLLQVDAAKPKPTQH